MVRIASLAKPCVRRIDRRSARGLHTFIRRCRRIPGTAVLAILRETAAPAPAPIMPIAPAAPAADSTGCLTIAPVTRLASGDFMTLLMAVDPPPPPPPPNIPAAPPPGITDLPTFMIDFPRPPRKEKKPGSPR